MFPADKREPEVKFHSIGIVTEELKEITASLPVDEKTLENHTLFTLAEGSKYQLKLTFSILHNLVSGLTYTNTVWKGLVQGTKRFSLRTLLTL